MKKAENQNLESLPTPKGSVKLGTKALGRNKSEFTLKGLSQRTPNSKLGTYSFTPTPVEAVNIFYDKNSAVALGRIKASEIHLEKIRRCSAMSGPPVNDMRSLNKKGSEYMQNQ